MRGPKPAVLELQKEEREALEALVRKHSTPQQIAQRGQMILLAAEGKNNEEIARELKACSDTVRTWRMRWIGWQKLTLEDFSLLERLSDLPRPGRPSEITSEQFCQLIMLACEQPKERPITHWTGREIADEVMQRGIIAQISPRHAARLLKRGTSNPI
jgi:putative transposase